MQDQARKKISDAILVVLKPLAQILLSCGIGYKEFADLAKVAFVETASKDYGIRGRPTNISRVAVMTGLTRKEVRRIRDLIDTGEPVSEVKVTPLAQVLRRWHSEPEFTDENGRPLPLRFDGEGLTFSELVRRFGGDIPAGAMRTEFKRVGAIVEDEDGKLVAQRRIARPEGLDDRVVTSLLHGAYPLLRTIAHNVKSQPGVDTWPQFTTFSERIRKSDSVRLLRVSRDRLEEAASSFDDLFMAYETLRETDPKRDRETVSVAVGLYYFEENEQEHGYIWKA